MAHLLPSPKMQFFDVNGDPLSGGKVNTYEAGTSTRKATYTTAAASVANANPVILDSRGEAAIFWSTGSYKIVLTDSDDVEVYTVDNITLSASGTAGASFRAGSGVPSDSLGSDGDRYLRTDTGQIYLKGSGVYSVETTMALPATAVTNTPSGNLVATTVQAALDELQTELDAATAHIADGTDAHAASAITNTPSGNLVATTVQAALDEIQTELDTATAHIADATDAHAASAITNTPSGNLAATTVQAALDELQTDVDGREPTITTLALNKGGTGQTTKAAAFDALSPMTTSGDIIYGGASGTGTRLAKGSDGQVLKLAAGLPSWAAESATSNLTITSIDNSDSPYTVLSTDDVILVDSSGGAVTVNLPTAVGITGKKYIIKKTSNDFTAVTIATNSTETIDGVDGTTINTQYESIEIVSDGTNWHVLRRDIPSVWTDSGAITIGATTTAPTKATGIIVDRLLWRRVGTNAEVRVEYNQSNTTSAAAGTGDYLFSLPSGISIDSSKVTFFTGVVGGAANFGLNNAAGAGQAKAGSNNADLTVSPYDGTNVRIFYNDTTSNGCVSATGYAVTGATVAYSFFYSVPISGWKG